MKKNAFTLAELLAIIAILGIIAVVVTPNITNILNDSKKSLNDTQIKAIEEAARNYGIQKITLVNNAPSKSTITLQELINNGYLDDKDVKNIINKQSVTEDGKVCVKWESNQFVYTYKESGEC